MRHGSRKQDVRFPSSMKYFFYTFSDFYEKNKLTFFSNRSGVFDVFRKILEKGRGE
jgi:hypothetical protein